MEKACHALDVKMSLLAKQAEGAHQHFAEACSNIQKSHQLKQQASDLEEAVSFLEEHLATLESDSENAAIYARMIQEHLA